MVNSTKYSWGKLEAIILVLIGIGTGVFSLSSNYMLLMNPKFRWLTMIGALLVLLLGVTYLFSSHKRNMTGVLPFILLILITLMGRPFLKNNNANLMILPPLGDGLLSQIDQARFPQIDLQTLYSSKNDYPRQFMTIGFVKRLPVLDQDRSFALMNSIMVCCAADMFAIGFCVPSGEFDKFQDGDWVVVCGKLDRPQTQILVPNFRFGAAMISMLNKNFIIQAEKILPYDRSAQLPTLIEKLETEGLKIFNQALKQTGLWQRLQGEGSYTVFAPVDKAFENLDEQLFLKKNRNHLKSLLSYHIIPGKLMTSDLIKRSVLRTIHGHDLEIHLVNGKLEIENTRILFKNTEARNGVIHFIYPVIAPD
jgi:uncharacterized surface protein with fasciclin (FAS1) repeats